MIAAGSVMQDCYSNKGGGGWPNNAPKFELATRISDINLHPRHVKSYTGLGVKAAIPIQQFEGSYSVTCHQYRKDIIEPCLCCRHILVKQQLAHL